MSTRGIRRNKSSFIRMNNQEQILSFLNLLDLDEEIIDTRLKSIMVRSNHTNTHLKNALQLLQYKDLLNTQEGDSCKNDDEFDFTVQLLRNINSENVDYICKIIKVVLCLNSSNIINKSEHLIQQILSDINLQTDESNMNPLDSDPCCKTMLNFKVCGSILDAVIQHNEKVSLLFLETPLENILDSTDEQLKLYFLTNTVPRLFEGTVGYNILDRIWNYLTKLKGELKENMLKTLCCLSDYYLPTPDDKGTVKYESEIIFLSDFWGVILNGITTNDTSVRKIAVFLLKRAIDCIISTNKNINIQTETQKIFVWDRNNSKFLKNMWDNYFVLIDSLEEKQSNIVLPSLKLFEVVDIGECWVNAAFNIGLRHDNTQVRLKCIEYKLKTKISTYQEATVLLEALNDINIYDDNTNYKEIKIGLKILLKNNESFLEMFRAIPIIKWSPVPFYHVTDVLGNLERRVPCDIANEIIAVLKVPCNNLVIRRAVTINMISFIRNSCNCLSWKDITNISSIIKDLQKSSLFVSIIEKMPLKDNERYECLKDLSENITNTDLLLTYLSNSDENAKVFEDIINEKMEKINEIVHRQYLDKKICVKDVIFLLHFTEKTVDINDKAEHIINSVIARQNKTLIQYILSLFSNDTDISIEDAAALFERHNYQFSDQDLEDILLQLNKTSILFLRQNQDLDKAILSIFTVKMLLKNRVLVKKYKHEMVNLKSFLQIISNLKFKDIQNESVGRFKNVFFEKSCEIVYLLVEEENHVQVCIKELISYIENILECGGYGCLKWILKVVNKIVNILVHGKTKFNMNQFINRVWNEIEELKSNNQYSPCIEEFVELITQDPILEKSMFNNVVILYSNKIIEYGPVKTNPLYYLTKILNKKGVKDYGHLVYILCEILLYCPVSRKDQRIADNLSLQILQDRKYVDKKCLDIHFNFEIQYLSIATLCRINDADTLNVITKFVTNKVDDTLGSKQRYHGNSQTHRILLATLQHMLIIFLKSTDDIDWVLNWSLDLLVKLPHQPSVRICLEWLVALCLYIKKMTLNEEMLQLLKSMSVPLNSQFFITYWLLKHKISNSTYTETEYCFLLDFLLSHTMGQLFNVRLHAQYLATILHKMVHKSTKFDYTISVIEKTLQENSNDKNYVKLVNDYFVNNFNIVANLNPYFVYYMLPKYCEIDNEKVNLEFVKNIMNNINDCFECGNEDFKTEWQSYQRVRQDYDELRICKDDSKVVDDTSCMGTIQKKYIPWKHMSDINVYDVGKKFESSSELIVVASLIDKLPNLGGMARTSEVFGVNTYVVDSLRHLQDKQFQGLSVSAERWINIEEVRPGRALKEYLMQKKAEGYSIVAAEQTSTSIKLQSFKFPKKSLLLLGHEKEGVPCDLLPIMDHCVEIPQQGYIRSLNVHVTAAIFVWEYARQNVL